MATTFLQHLNQYQEESGTGNILIASVSGLTGEGLRLKNQIQRATIEIQSMAADWKFLKVLNPTAITTGVGTADYTGASDLNMWNRKAFVIDGTVVPEENVIDYNPATFPRAPTTNGVPRRVYLLPNNQIRLWPTPDAAYSVEYQYWKQPVPFTEGANSEVSVIPYPYDAVILYKALEYYATFEDAPEIMAKAKDGWNVWWPKLEAHQKPNHQYGIMSDDVDIVIRAE